MSGHTGGLSHSSSSSSDNRLGVTPRGKAAGQQNSSDESREYTPYLPTPTAKSAARILNERATHGARVQSIAEGQRLWSRLDEEEPEGPENPKTGFAVDAIQYAKYGREYLRIGLEQTPAKAWAYWRSRLRTHTNQGGTEAELYEDYREAVRAYQRRHRRHNR